MEIEKIVTLIFNYGFPTVALIFVCIAGWKLVIQIQGHNKEREDKLMGIIQEDLKHTGESQKSTIDALKEFRQSVDKANEYQRQEHIKMLDFMSELQKEMAIRR